ncbi:uncharacterized protein NMK_2048 [Novimethylophilus kurashikiensis]|uniref:Uncharacterized protein n=1 Tax=Novimethylophilus kurashikiensis TaxID=1825523 RepID=A0A2R5F9F5_9PROT|nr:hypothetical protein [Novimethylophilus kurashikiensis]GBG14449.1 uncharacterized protein NMK_2048 [Novimethylophilus kurashikiensis]
MSALELVMLTEKQELALDACHASQPICLVDADITKPFVYDRWYGFFYVPPGYHQLSMATLLAFHHGEHRAVEAAKKLGLAFSGGAAEHWLKTIPGAAFKSSQGRLIAVGTFRNLSPLERRVFGGNLDNLKLAQPPT